MRTPATDHRDVKRRRASHPEPPTRAARVGWANEPRRAAREWNSLAEWVKKSTEVDCQTSRLRTDFFPTEPGNSIPRRRAWLTLPVHW